jgi:hypothetical protein
MEICQTLYMLAESCTGFALHLSCLDLVAGEEFANSLPCIEASGEDTTLLSDLLCEFVVLEVVVVVCWWGTS